MKHRRFPLVIALAALAVVAQCLSGCRPQSNAPQQPATRAAAQSSPEESLELVFEVFRDGIEEIPIGFFSQDSTGHTLMTGRNEASYEVIPPQGEGENYRATITVKSQTRYSIQRSTGETDDQSESENDRTSNRPGGLNDSSGLQVFDQELISTAGPADASRRLAPKPGTEKPDIPDRWPDEQVRTYELAHKDGRWVLVTKLDPDTERSVEHAFDRALRTQN